jgi:putative aldouronate transport system substrate-binding protein
MKRLSIVTICLVLSCAVVFAQPQQEVSETAASQHTTEFSYYYMADQQPMEDEVFSAVNGELASRYGITCNFNRLDGSAYTERMNVLLAAQEPIDLMFIANWCLDYAQKLAQGALMPLDDLIAENAPKLVPSLPPFLMDVTLYNGDHYAVPNYQTIVNQRAFLVRQDLADRYGLDVDALSGLPLKELLVEFEPFLAEIKAHEPDLFPIAPEWTWQGLFESVGGAMILVEEAPTLKIEDGELHEYKGGLEQTYRDWYREGYIRRDVATASSDEKKRDKENLKYALWAAPYKLGAEAEAKARYGTDIAMIPIGEPFVGAQAGISTMYAISTFAQEPEAAIKFVEIMNTDEDLYNMMCFGIEGVTYEKTAPQRIEFITDADDNKLYHPRRDWMFGNQFNAYLIPGMPDGIWEATDKLNRSARTSPARGFVVDLEPVRDIQARVSAADREYWGTEFLYIDDEAKYQALQEERKEKVKRAGIFEVHEEVQRQLIEWAKANGKPYEERVINWDPTD